MTKFTRKDRNFFLKRSNSPCAIARIVSITCNEFDWSILHPVNTKDWRIRLLIGRVSRYGNSSLKKRYRKYAVANRHSIQKKQLRFRKTKVQTENIEDLMPRGSQSEIEFETTPIWLPKLSKTNDNLILHPDVPRVLLLHFLNHPGSRENM